MIARAGLPRLVFQARSVAKEAESFFPLALGLYVSVTFPGIRTLLELII